MYHTQEVLNLNQGFEGACAANAFDLSSYQEPKKTRFGELSDGDFFTFAGEILQKKGMQRAERVSKTGKVDFIFLKKDLVGYLRPLSTNQTETNDNTSWWTPAGLYYGKIEEVKTAFKKTMDNIGKKGKFDMFKSRDLPDYIQPQLNPVKCKSNSSIKISFQTNDQNLTTATTFIDDNKIGEVAVFKNSNGFIQGTIDLGALEIGDDTLVNNSINIAQDYCSVYIDGQAIAKRVAKIPDSGTLTIRLNFK